MDQKQYERRILEPAEALERHGLCSIISLGQYCTDQAGEAIALVNTASPTSLVTSCHHGNEIHATYSTIFDIIEKESLEGVFVPVIDVLGFCETWDALEKEKSEISVYSSVKNSAYMTRKPAWSYGTGKEGIIGSIEDTISQVDCIVDLHNWIDSSYLFIHKFPEAIVKPEQYLEDLSFMDSIGSILAENREPLYSGSQPMLRSRELGPGLYECMISNKNIVNYAASLGKKALAVEVPVFEPGLKFKDFCKLADTNVEIIKAFTQGGNRYV